MPMLSFLMRYLNNSNCGISTCRRLTSCLKKPGLTFRRAVLKNSCGINTIRKQCPNIGRKLWTIRHSLPRVLSEKYKMWPRAKLGSILVLTSMLRCRPLTNNTSRALKNANSIQQGKKYSRTVLPRHARLVPALAWKHPRPLWLLLLKATRNPWACLMPPWTNQDVLIRWRGNILT